MLSSVCGSRPGRDPEGSEGGLESPWWHPSQGPRGVHLQDQLTERVCEGNSRWGLLPSTATTKNTHNLFWEEEVGSHLAEERWNLHQLAGARDFGSYKSRSRQTLMQRPKRVEWDLLHSAAVLLFVKVFVLISIQHFSLFTGHHFFLWIKCIYSSFL